MLNFIDEIQFKRSKHFSHDYFRPKFQRNEYFLNFCNIFRDVHWNGQNNHFFSVAVLSITVNNLFTVWDKIISESSWKKSQRQKLFISYGNQKNNFVLFASTNKLHIFCITKRFFVGNCSCTSELFLHTGVNALRSSVVALSIRSEAGLAWV